MKTKIIALLFFVICLVSCNKKATITSDELLVLKDTTITFKNSGALDILYYKLIKSSNDSVKRNLLFQVANKFYDINKPDKYFEIVSKINELASIQNDSMHIAKTFNCIGYYYYNKTKLDSAFKYYLKSEKIYKTLRDTSNCGKLKMYKSGIYFDTGSFVESEIEAVEALKYIAIINNPRLNYQCYLTIALSLNEMKNFSKSLVYFDLAMNQIDILERTNEPKNSISIFRVSCFNSKGRIYEKEKKYVKAIGIYKKGLEVANIKKLDPILYAAIVSNLAYSKMQNGNLEGVEKMLFESYKIRDSLKSEAGIISSKLKIGEYYLYKKDTIKGFENILSCYNLSKKVKSIPDVLKTLKILSAIDAKNKSFFTNEYIRISDSSQVAERNTRNKFARIAYETEQIEEENAILSKRNTYIIIGSFIAIFFMGIAFVVYRLKSKNKELKHTHEQQIKNEEIYQLLLKQQSISDESRKGERNRIAMELHDGVVNSVFTTRFNLMQLESNQTDKKSELIKELEKTEAEIRRVSHELNENLNFNDNSLVNMIINLVESQKNEWNTKFDVTIDKFINWNQIESETKMNMYRIIQEALQNVNKYTKAERCVIMLLKTANKTTIRIWDNGIGFDIKKIKKGIGLKNIEKRVIVMSGSLKINSKMGKGTTIEVIF